MAKKKTTTVPENFTTTVDNEGNLAHSVTSKGAMEMKKMSDVFEFGFTCASVQAIPDTRITNLSERYTFQSEDLPNIEIQLAEARTGQRLPYDTFKALTDRAANLRKKDKMLLEFWSPDKGDAEALARREQAHQMLLQLLDPEQVLSQRSARLHKEDGEIVTYPIQFGPVEATEQFASVTHSDQGAKALARAIHLANTCAAHWFDGRGVLFLRPVGEDGTQPNPIFVTADNTYTVVADSRGGSKFLPFNQGYDPTSWKLAALLVTGHQIDVVMTDTALYDTPVFRNRVADQLVKAEFIDAFGKWALPYTKRAFIEARYPQDPIKGLLAQPVAQPQEREVFEF